MRKILLMLLCLTLFSGCVVKGSDSIAKDQELQNEGYTVLRVGMEAGYAPYNWQEESPSDTNMPISNVPGAYAEGYDIAIARAISQEMQVEVEIVKLSWEGLIEALNNEQIDLIIAGMADTQERKESINFSDAYTIPGEYCILVKSGSEYSSATKLSDFSGAAILGQQNTQYDTVIPQIENVYHVPAVSDVANMILRLKEGTVDGLVFDESTADAYLNTYPGEFEVVYFDEGAGFDKGFSGGCIGIRKSDTQLLSDVNKALATIDLETRKEWNEIAEANMPQ